VIDDRRHAHSLACWWHATDARWVCGPVPAAPTARLGAAVILPQQGAGPREATLAGTRP
jgi:hypothetical protein